MGIHVGCAKGKNEKPFIIFREFCSGNACLENIYGAYDLDSKKLIINPNDWPKGNRNQIQKLLENNDYLLKEKENFFCCYQQLYGNQD